MLVSGLVVGIGYPFVMQRFIVDPSERSLEQPYIQHNIDFTRQAYGVSDLVSTEYKATTNATPGALRADAETTANIRIIDPALVSDSFAQLEQSSSTTRSAPISTSTATPSTARRKTLWSRPVS